MLHQYRLRLGVRLRPEHSLPMHTILVRLFPVILLLASGAAPAQEPDRDAVIAYRQWVMKSQGAHLSAIATLLRSNLPYRDQLVVHAEALYGTAGQIATLFPPGTHGEIGETDARNTIWRRPERFKARADGNLEAATALVTAVRGGDPEIIRPAMDKLRRTCKACHSEFRADR